MRSTSLRCSWIDSCAIWPKFETPPDHLSMTGEHALKSGYKGGSANQESWLRTSEWI